jgi:hypothetical protein
VVREVAEETRGEHHSEEGEQLDESQVEDAQRARLQSRDASSRSHSRCSWQYRPASPHGASGSVTTRGALARSLRTDTSPSHMSTRLRTSVSPRPEPRQDSHARRTNGRNTRFKSSGGNAVRHQSRCAA